MRTAEGIGAEFPVTASGELEFGPQVSVSRGYSPRNHLASVGTFTTPHAVIRDWHSFAYDGRGVRVHLGSTGEGPTGYVHEADYVYTPELNLSLVRSRNSGSTTELVWFNGHPVAQVSSDAGPTLYTFTDHLGTPIVQTGAAGTITWFGGYEPYGRLYALRGEAAFDQPLRLPGQDVAHGMGAIEESYNVAAHQSGRACHFEDY